MTTQVATRDINSNAVGEPVEVVLVGLGHRTVGYAAYGEQHPEQLRVVAVVDPDPIRRAAAAERFGVAEDRQYDYVTDLPAEPLARAAINGTMDALHVSTSLELLDRGYDLLLEKPIALDPDSMLQLQHRADELGRTVVVCHVLRHAPFYATIKQLIADGEIGDVLTVDLCEAVSYDHFATGFVRGRWRSEEACGSSFLMAKSCHDMDLMAWFAAPGVPVSATSMGSLRHFTEAKAPAGSGSRCVGDCAIEETCAYSAKRIYLDLNLHGWYAWESLEHLGRQPTHDEKLASLAGDNPMGRCVWRCDNDVTDHQVVSVEFDNGTTGNLTLTANSAQGDRTIHIVGTRGEIKGSLVSETFTVGRFGSRDEQFTTETISTTAPPDAEGYAGLGHGGGDLRLVADFLAVLRGEAPSLSTTALADSVNGHLAGFAAEQGRVERRWVDLAELRR
ncbi:Gfo/Idh/MocA family protein [Propionibacteriaceae bacterium Y2011]|uniref:Gfo/Idh/MocA family protein n=1 Tax=Microlunatus sp. Y2014 TaxID=3418488 RepID=UPI003B4A2A3B